MYNERKRKIIENVIVGVVLLRIFVGVFALNGSGKEWRSIKPAPTAKNGAYDFDDFMYWLKHDAFPSGMSNAGVAANRRTFPIDGKELEYDELYTDGTLVDYKGTTIANDLVWLELNDGNIIYCDIYYPIVKDNSEYLIAELSTGVCVLFKKCRVW